MNKRIAFLVSGGGTNMQAVIDEIKKGGIKAHPVLMIASNRDCYALKRAEKENIPVFILPLKEFKDRESRDAAILKLLKEYKVDLLLLAGFLGIINDNIINAYQNRIMNIHPALLPSFGGAGFHGLHVHEAAIRRGVKVTGATVHFVDNVVDGGMIILQKAVEVKDGDTPEILQKRVMEEAEYVIYPTAVKLFCEDRLITEDGRVRIKR